MYESNCQNEKATSKLEENTLYVIKYLYLDYTKHSSNVIRQSSLKGRRF
jgi:hypothetical protein